MARHPVLLPVALAVQVEPITSPALEELAVQPVAELAEPVLKVAVVAVVEAFRLALLALLALAGPERKFPSQREGLRVLVAAVLAVVLTHRRREHR